MKQNRHDFLATGAVAVTLTGSAGLFGTPVLAATGDATQPGPPLQNFGSYAAPTDVKEVTIVNLRELEPAAQKVIPPGGFGYIASAAGDEWTKHENEAAYKRVTIIPRYLSGLDGADTTTTLLGQKISMPIIVTVMGGHGLAHASAEAGTARGAAAAGTLMIAPSQSNVTLEDTMKAGDGPKFFQIYIPKDRGMTRDVLVRAKAAGYKAIVVTIDAFVSSNRETDVRNHFHSTLPNANFPGVGGGGYGSSPFKENLGWDDIAFVRDVTGLPVLIKGVLSPALATEAIKHGVAGIQVSNHGGRQLDDTPASFTVLPRIADAVGGRIPIIVDGGIRRGQDVFKALAMGANACAIGRPVLFGLALGGWMGVQGVLQHLNTELTMTMRLGGVRSIADITRDHLSIG
ncbi:MAG TPA: alpha-hydroxy acid oxidase [Candidatus Lustribacter sp.]|jgi:lactate oxidase|nr:alpha-hydroxy acid oxidase [Candidatus Lustribacter sp.]